MIDANWTRRAFLRQAPGWAAMGLTAEHAPGAAGGPGPLDAPGREQAPSEPPVPIVDTHVHLWDLGAVNVWWVKLPGWEVLDRNYLVADFAEATRGLHVTVGVYMEVFVEAADLDKEVEYVLRLCRRGDTPIKAAVIGGRPESPGFRAYIDRYAGDRHIKGVRRVLHNQDMPRGACLEPRFVESVKHLGELDLSFDLSTRPGELLDGVKLMDRCPKTRFVIDHCGNAEVGMSDAVRGAWERGIREAAQRDHAVCKISGIVRTAKKDGWTPGDLAPAIDACLDAFGPDRVMFGGDWPAILVRSTYRQWTEALRQIVRSRSPAFRRKLFHDNAVKFFKLSDVA